MYDDTEKAVRDALAHAASITEDDLRPFSLSVDADSGSRRRGPSRSRWVAVVGVAAAVVLITASVVVFDRDRPAVPPAVDSAVDGSAVDGSAVDGSAVDGSAVGATASADPVPTTAPDSGYTAQLSTIPGVLLPTTEPPVVAGTPTNDYGIGVDEFELAEVARTVSHIVQDYPGFAASGIDRATHTATIWARSSEWSSADRRAVDREIAKAKAAGVRVVIQDTEFGEDELVTLSTRVVEEMQRRGYTIDGQGVGPDRLGFGGPELRMDAAVVAELRKLVDSMVSPTVEIYIKDPPEQEDSLMPDPTRFGVGGG